MWKKNIRTRSENFVSETELEVIKDDTKKYKYLGILYGTKIEQNPHNLYEKYSKMIKNLIHNPLLPWQVIDA